VGRLREGPTEQSGENKVLSLLGVSRRSGICCVPLDDDDVSLCLCAKYYGLRATEGDWNGWYDDPGISEFRDRGSQGVESVVVVEWMTTQARFLLRGCERADAVSESPRPGAGEFCPAHRTAASVDHTSLPSHMTRPLWQPTSRLPLDVRVSTVQTVSLSLFRCLMPDV
jgi:hypothetical protein